MTSFDVQLNTRNIKKGPFGYMNKRMIKALLYDMLNTTGDNINGIEKMTKEQLERELLNYCHYDQEGILKESHGNIKVREYINSFNHENDPEYEEIYDEPIKISLKNLKYVL